VGVINGVVLSSINVVCIILDGVGESKATKLMLFNFNMNVMYAHNMVTVEHFLSKRSFIMNHGSGS